MVRPPRPSSRVRRGAGGAPDTAAPNDFAGTARTVWVRPGKQADLAWPLDREGRYDVIVTAHTGRRFTQRYAGH
ncbi:phospholipase domain-containing protein [Kitasatospora brasiliensis]|uniref:phospholipase domain-containing protein n=1 Tax=Kitasatospora brasiliensis TaxID=3058040 RepID=UPI00292F7EFE|nr:phospholipase domain-containing protein [Kitasatospora sp. K002]